MPTLSEVWKNFGIVEPAGDLAVHPDSSLRGLAEIGKKYGKLLPELESQIDALILIAYRFGKSAGRLEALENPAKAMQVEVQMLLDEGVKESDISAAIRTIVKECNV